MLVLLWFGTLWILLDLSVTRSVEPKDFWTCAQTSRPVNAECSNSTSDSTLDIHCTCIDVSKHVAGNAKKSCDVSTGVTTGSDLVCNLDFWRCAQTSHPLDAKCSDSTSDGTLDINCTCIDVSKQVAGNANRSCDLSNGITTGSDLVCKLDLLLVCAEPPDVPYAKFVPSLANDTYRASYSCLFGYRRVGGDENRACELTNCDGSESSSDDSRKCLYLWTGTDLICEDVPDYMGEKFHIPWNVHHINAFALCFLAPIDATTYVAMATVSQKNILKILVFSINITLLECIDEQKEDLTDTTGGWVIESDYHISVCMKSDFDICKPFIPTERLGYEYMFAINYFCLNDLEIIAIEEDTFVIIRHDEINVVRTLDSMDVVKWESPVCEPSSAAVTWVRADKKIVVSILSMGSYTLHLPPVSVFGMNYVVPAVKDSVMVISTRSNTSVSYSRENIFLSQKGEILHTKELNELTVIKANKPIIVIYNNLFYSNLFSSQEQIIAQNIINPCELEQYYWVPVFLVAVHNITDQEEIVLMFGQHDNQTDIKWTHYNASQFDSNVDNSEILTFQIRVEMNCGNEVYWIQKANDSKVIIFYTGLESTGLESTVPRPVAEGLRKLTEDCQQSIRNMTHGDGIDNDCDGLTDEDICVGTLHKTDIDGDGINIEDCMKLATLPATDNAFLDNVTATTEGDAVVVVADFKCDNGTEFLVGSGKMTLPDLNSSWNGNFVCGDLTERKLGRTFDFYRDSPPEKKNAKLADVAIDTIMTSVTAKYICDFGTKLKNGSLSLVWTNNTWNGDFVCEDVPDYIGKRFLLPVSHLMEKDLYCVVNPTKHDASLAVSQRTQKQITNILVFTVPSLEIMCQNISGEDGTTEINITLFVAESDYNVGLHLRNSGMMHILSVEFIPVSELGFTYISVTRGNGTEYYVILTALEDNTTVYMRLVTDAGFEYVSSNQSLTTTLIGAYEPLLVGNISTTIYVTANKKISMVNFQKGGTGIFFNMPAVSRFGRKYEIPKMDREINLNLLNLKPATTIENKLKMNQTNHEIKLLALRHSIDMNISDECSLLGSLPFIASVRYSVNGYELFVLLPPLEQAVNDNIVQSLGLPIIGSNAEYYVFGENVETNGVSILLYNFEGLNYSSHLSEGYNLIEMTFSPLYMHCDAHNGSFLKFFKDEGYFYPVREGLKEIQEECIISKNFRLGDGIDNDCDNRKDEELCFEINGQKLDEDGDKLYGEDCMDLPCGDPPEIENAELISLKIENDKNTSPINIVAGYKCLNGSILVGERAEKSCSDSADWVGNFVCKREDEMCPCDCLTLGGLVLNGLVPEKPMTEERLKEVQRRADNLYNELIITKERSSLSSTRTKKISAEDERPSAKAAGYVAIVVLLAIAGGIILLDLNRLLHSFKMLHGNMVRPLDPED